MLIGSEAIDLDSTETNGSVLFCELQFVAGSDSIPLKE